MNDNLETRTKPILSSQVSSMVGAVPHSALILCRDKLKCKSPERL